MSRSALNWIWPDARVPGRSIWVRAGRFVHWLAVGFALFGLAVSLYGMVQVPGGEPVAYFAVITMWSSVALLGRGIRYLIASE